MVECLFTNEMIVGLNSVAVANDNIIFKCFLKIAECENNTSPTSFNGQLP